MNFRERLHELSLDSPEAPVRHDEDQVPGARRVDKGLREWVAVVEAGTDITQFSQDATIADVVIHPMTLEDVFVELVRKKEAAGDVQGAP